MRSAIRQRWPATKGSGSSASAPFERKMGCDETSSTHQRIVPDATTSTTVCAWARSASIGARGEGWHDIY